MHRVMVMELIDRLKSKRYKMSLLFSFVMLIGMTTGSEDFMNKYHVQIHPWMAPHIFTSWKNVIVLGLVVCFMYSDVPYMNNKELYRITRIGRKKWCMGKILGISMEAVAFSLSTMIFSVIVYIPYVDLGLDWGNVIYTMTYAPIRGMSRCYGNIIQSYEPVEAMLLQFILMCMVTALVGLIMFSVSLWIDRRAVIVLCLGSIGIMSVIDAMPMFRFLDYIIPFEWMRIGEFGRYVDFYIQFPDMKYCLYAIIITATVCIAATILRIKKINVVLDKEE